MIYNLAYESDTTCIAQLRMNRSSFIKLCCMLENEGGLKGTRYMEVDEQVAISLHLIAHHVKNRTIQFRFKRSGETISRQFSLFLNVVIRLQNVLFENPKTIAANSIDWRWKWFKNCLGALDGTHIKVRVPSEDRPRYWTRKGEIATNALAACSQDMQFTYVLAGWEGSVADCKVLRDAITRTNGLKVPHGHYYLVNAGYTNCEGFLAPYRGQRYHLNEWRDERVPRSPREFFNMKHSAARNVIERCFGLLKMRWAILRSLAYYPIHTQNRIILACCLLQNFLRREMSGDLAERRLERRLDNQQDEVDKISENLVDMASKPSEESCNSRRPGKNKHQWSNKEDVALIEALMQLNNVGGLRKKNEKGFRPRHGQKLQQMLDVILPGHGIKAKRHIESRLRTFQKLHNVVHDMLYGVGSSGFGWESEKKYVTAENDVWVEYLKTHPDAEQFRYKSLPYYEELSIILGGDRASEKDAQVPADIVEELEKVSNENDDENCSI
ncbi:protein ANTAGONIST OF LIKE HETEROCHROMATIN PROTEIN 1-like [Curcuma longa]|uniref:protein ANTAGONIST OF LIKE HETEROCHROMATIN PROTEIN 1-like n=1 Tax=Curcuma longa TaxID=136217 RepID=UPI003D9FAF2B